MNYFELNKKNPKNSFHFAYSKSIDHLREVREFAEEKWAKETHQLILDKALKEDSDLRRQFNFGTIEFHYWWFHIDLDSQELTDRLYSSLTFLLEKDPEGFYKSCINYYKTATDYLLDLYPDKKVRYEKKTLLISLEVFYEMVKTFNEAFLGKINSVGPIHNEFTYVELELKERI